VERVFFFFFDFFFNLPTNAAPYLSLSEISSPYIPSSGRLLADATSPEFSSFVETAARSLSLSLCIVRTVLPPPSSGLLLAGTASLEFSSSVETAAPLSLSLPLAHSPVVPVPLGGFSLSGRPPSTRPSFTSVPSPATLKKKKKVLSLSVCGRICCNPPSYCLFLWSLAGLKSHLDFRYKVLHLWLFVS
jgi:hypothetical protein